MTHPGLPFGALVAASAIFLTAAGPTLPVRTPGLWEDELISEGKPLTSQLCLDEPAAAQLSVTAMLTDPDCISTSIEPAAGDTYRFESVCDLGSMGVTRRTISVTGDVTSRFVVHAKMSTTGSELNLLNGEFKIVSRRLGPCQADQRGGDYILNGRVIANILDARRRGVNQ